MPDLHLKRSTKRSPPHQTSSINQQFDPSSPLSMDEPVPSEKHDPIQEGAPPEEPGDPNEPASLFKYKFAFASEGFFVGCDAKGRWCV